MPKKEIVVQVEKDVFHNKENGKSYPYLVYSVTLSNGFVARLVPLDRAHKTMLNFEFLEK